MFHFKNKEIKDLFQWSRDIVLEFDPIYAGEEVHFSNNKTNSLNKKINGNGEVTIPNILLTESMPIEVYLFIKEGPEQYTKKKKFYQLLPDLNQKIISIQKKKIKFGIIRLIFFKEKEIQKKFLVPMKMEKLLQKLT